MNKKTVRKIRRIRSTAGTVGRTAGRVFISAVVIGGITVAEEKLRLDKKSIMVEIQVAELYFRNKVAKNKKIDIALMYQWITQVEKSQSIMNLGRSRFERLVNEIEEYIDGLIGDVEIEDKDIVDSIKTKDWTRKMDEDIIWETVYYYWSFRKKIGLYGN